MTPPPASDPKREGRMYLRAFGRALTDRATYDSRNNPSVWLGFVLAIPIPVLAFAADAAVWLEIATILAPIGWAIVLGAAGRVALLAARERARLAREVGHFRDRADASDVHLSRATEALGAEQRVRRQLERDQKVVLSELKLAQAVQSTLAAEDIDRADVQVVARSIPSRFVGGDYAHTAVVENHWLYLVVADVAGHGVAAALVVARLHGLFRRLTLTKKAPEAILERLNGAALRIFEHTTFFMTVGVFRLDLHTGELEYATAGHPAQALLRGDGQFELLRTPNLLLGMDADIFGDTPAKRTRLEPGDTLVLFTDGLFEILSTEAGEMLGEQGLLDRIRAQGGLEPSLMVGEVLQDLADFQGHSEFEDDVTLVVARYLGRPAATVETQATPQEAGA